MLYLILVKRTNLTFRILIAKHICLRKKVINRRRSLIVEALSKQTSTQAHIIRNYGSLNNVFIVY